MNIQPLDIVEIDADKSVASENSRKAVPPWLLGTVLLMSLALFINYIDRGSLATAAPLIKSELNLSATQLGLLLGAFLIKYTPMQLAVGLVADRFDAGRALVTGVIVWPPSFAYVGLYSAARREAGSLRGAACLIEQSCCQVD